MISNYRCYRLSAKEKREYYGAAIVLLALLGVIYYNHLLVALLLTTLSLPGQKILESALAQRRRNLLRGQLRDLLYAISASVQTGRQLSQALAESLETLRLIYAPEEPILTELQHMIEEMQQNHVPEDTLLLDLADRADLEELRHFAEVCQICRSAGGDLDRAVMTAAGVLSDRITLEQELKAATAQKRLEARLLCATPTVVIGLMQILSPDYLAVLYSGPAGRLIMTTALFMTGIAFAWSGKLMQPAS